MSNLSQFVAGSSSGIYDVICARKVTICQGGGIILNKEILGPCNPGCFYACGHVMCVNGSLKWIVSPRNTEVIRTWYCRDDASAVAQVITGCTGWFVPTCGQLLNPGYTCRTYWDLYYSTCYWSSSGANNGCVINFNTGNVLISAKTNTHYVRAFRCVTY